MTITPAYMYLIRIQYAILSLNDLFLLLLEQELLKLNSLYVSRTSFVGKGNDRLAPPGCFLWWYKIARAPMTAQ